MIKRFNITIYLLMAVVLFMTGCELVELDDTYNFKIVSTNGPFKGYYMVNEDSMEFFASEPVVGNSNLYYYEENLPSLNSITIYAEGMDTSAASISIYIYDNNELGESITVPQSTDSSGNNLEVTATLSYTFGSSNE